MFRIQILNYFQAELVKGLPVRFFIEPAVVVKEPAGAAGSPVARAEQIVENHVKGKNILENIINVKRPF